MLEETLTKWTKMQRVIWDSCLMSKERGAMRSHMTKARAKERLDVSWFVSWLKGWGRPYLTPAALKELWRAIPREQKGRWESLADEMREQFAREEDMDAQVEAFLQEARQLAAARLQAAYEAECHDGVPLHGRRAQAPGDDPSEEGGCPGRKP